MDLLPASAAPDKETDDELWYKDAVIYELHVKAFFDGNNDGIGDFNGLTRKLDYIRDLGVNTIWLLPFYPSPLKDDGYDVADYHGVLPAYGTRADFRHFVREAHRRGLRVITELVMNHTSDQHAWFQAARRAPPGSAKRDYYVWSDDPTRYSGTRIIFTDTETSNWTWDPVAGAYFWHRFFSHQPDLNFENPRVLRAVLRTMRFWLDMGVDGFRLDAIPYLREREGTNNENLPETHEVIREIRKVIDANYRGRVLLAEANQWPEDVREYFGDGDECHMCYHFPLMPRLFMAVAQEDRFPVVDIMRQTPDIPENSQWAIFLRNHDELTLEMVTDRERDYMWQFFARDPRMRINVGIRRRLAPLLENSRDRIELMSFLLLTMPGSPIVYYGDELGMGDNVFLGDRDGVRTPMQWSWDRNAGFSRADPQQLYLPPIMDPVYGFQAINVEAQARNPHSLLNFTRRLITMRNGSKAFGRGTLRFLEPGNRKVLAYLREYRGQSVLCVANLARTPQAVELDLSRFEGRVPVEMVGQVSFPPIGKLPYLLTLPGHGFFGFELSTTASPPNWHEERLPQSELPILVLTEGWRTFFRGNQGGSAVRRAIATRSREQLQSEVLVPYLQARRWFAAKGETITRVEVVDEQEWAAGGGTWLLALLEVGLARGDAHQPLTDATSAEAPASQTYFLPLAIAWEGPGDDPADRFGAAALARVREKARMGILYDAFIDPAFCRALGRAMRENRTYPLGNGSLRFSSAPDYDRLADALDEDVRQPSLEQTNTGVFFGSRLYLKGYRRLQYGINPELEIGYFFAARGHSAHVAAMAGAIEYVGPDGTPAALALLQEYVDNQGNGWEYTLDHLNRLFPQDIQPAVADDADADSMDRVYLTQMETLGRRVGEMHAAFADGGENPAFKPDPLEEHEVARWRARVIADIDLTFGRLETAAARTDEPRLDARFREEAGLVLAAREAIVGAIEALNLDPRGVVKTRLHGDLHLGQVLIVPNDVVIVDFEGEPARPIDERRAKHSPLRDVAGMLRSFDYAARMVANRHAVAHPEHGAAAAAALAEWKERVVAAFMNAYGAAAAGLRSVPADGVIAGDFLTLFVLEKLLYELRYELDNRPDWARVPLAALLEFAQPALPVALPE
ncbi:MAG: maltose alpha-D-glucosyltransferase [Aromatoleum sp.]|jgi:maltose alpha-D-glucosyltransferase/alpha-amylase|uniref:maltose alpha-D-glucosyltransferase n=1 Tax=Aromatoleum sp. TaxID=2307007 RepID=UPI002895BF89|nr:maltose alpha-D-glucosyltransferase [Aromatoleum sp.]MDT3671095.1 maltose alpha-D-glucosyltransferase [Aromatoleum sp.]